MGMTSTQGHWIPGVFIIAVALFAILHETGVVKRRWIAYVFPIAIILVGLQGILDKFMHGSAAPTNYGAETIQHIVQGSILLAAGIVELLRVRGVLAARWWGLALPAALVFVAVVFLRHAQHDSAVPMLTLLVQHRAFGLTILVAAAARALAELAPQRAAGFRLVFATMFLLFGLQFTIYTEGEGSTDKASASHPMNH